MLCVLEGELRTSHKVWTGSSSITWVLGSPQKLLQDTIENDLEVSCGKLLSFMVDSTDQNSCNNLYFIYI